jgi:hypothetical protein
VKTAFYRARVTQGPVAVRRPPRVRGIAHRASRFSIGRFSRRNGPQAPM